MNPRRTITLLLTLALAAPLSAQRMNEAVQVTVVEVPVTVVDREGKAVTGLTAENFELYDEGKRVPIEYFDVLDLTTTAKTADAPAEALPPAATRHFLLLFDLANSSPGTIGRSREAATQFVTRDLGPRDLAAVATFTAEAGARMVTNFTRDRRLLTNAIETLGHPKYFRVADPLMISANVGAHTQTESGPGAAVDAEAIFAELTQDQQRLAKSAHDGEMRNRLRIQFSNMGKVARALDRLRGQKQIILLSEGFDARLVQGREDLGAEATKEADTVMAGEVWKVDSEARYGSSSSTTDVRDMAELFRRSDVILHAIDIKGLRGSSDVTSASAMKGKSVESLHLLTAPTGGTVFKNSNDLGDTFTKMLKQQETIYLLGFQARSTGKPGKFHTLKVKAPNVRAARINHRLGYYEPSAQISDLERNLTLAEILMTDAQIEDVVVNLGATTLPGPGGKARIPVVVEIPAEGLLQDLKGSKANAQLFLYAFNQNDQVIDFLQERIGVDLDAAGDAVRKGGVRYYGTLRLPPGRYAVKALVRVAETGRIGYKREDVEVPAFDKAAIMPPVVFEEPGQWAMLFGPSRGDEYPYPFAVGDAKYIPKSEPVVKAGGEYKIALFLNRVPLENLSVLPTLVTSGGTSQPANVTLLGRSSADERGSVKLIFNFQPKAIAAGRHELRFDVKAKDGTETAVSLPFIVR